MNGKKQETISDILAEMRIELNQSWHDIDREKVHDFPDRIEAAMKRYCEDCTWYHIYSNGLLELHDENDRLRAKTSIKTLDKAQPAVNRFEKAVCIPMVLISATTTVACFSNSHYYCGIMVAICTLYWANKVRTFFS